MMTQYLIVGANGWSIDPDFRTAYTKWRFHASHHALKTPKEVRVIIYQVDTTNLDFKEGHAPVWIDEMGMNTHWLWNKEYHDRKTALMAGETPLTSIYEGPLSKAPKTNPKLQIQLRQTKYDGHYGPEGHYRKRFSNLDCGYCATQKTTRF